MKELIDIIDNKIKFLHCDENNKKLRVKLELLKRLAVYIERNDVSGRLDEVIILGDMNTGYSEYRIVNDCESDDSKFWIQYMHNTENVRLSPGDFLLKMK